MQYRYLQFIAAPCVLASLAVLAACGGGGGGSTVGGGVVPVTPTSCPAGYTGTAPNCVAPTGATATGKLVDDSTGSALGGVPVGLAPWVAGATPTPEGTTAPDGTFAFTAQPGHYLLVIGSDSVNDTTRATLHDNVTLVAGANALQAPMLPPWPTVTPPPWETNGTYRLQTIDAVKELPCLNAYNQHRVGAGLPKVVEDEWLKENARDATAWARSGQYNPANQTSASRVLSTAGSGGGGGVDCAGTVLAQAYSGSNAPYSGSANNQWFGGIYAAYQPGDTVSAFGVAEFPLDPRFQADPVGIWP